MVTRVAVGVLLAATCLVSAAESEEMPPFSISSFKEDLADEAKDYLITKSVDFVTEHLQDSSVFQEVMSELGMGKVKAFWDRISGALNGYTPSEAQLVALEGYVAKWDAMKEAASNICSSADAGKRQGQVLAAGEARFVAAGKYSLTAGPLNGFAQFMIDDKGVVSPAVALGFTLAPGTECSEKAEKTCSVQGKTCNSKGDDWECTCDGSSCTVEDLSKEKGDIDIDECKLDSSFYLEQPSEEYKKYGKLPECSADQECEDTAGSLGSVECVAAPKPSKKKALIPKGEAFVELSVETGSGFTPIPDTLLQLPAPYDYLTFVINFKTLAMKFQVDLVKYEEEDSEGSSDGVRGAFLAGLEHMKSLTKPSLQGAEELLQGFTLMAYKQFQGVQTPIPSALNVLIPIVTPVVNVLLQGKIELPFCIGNCAASAPASSHVSGEGGVKLIETDRGCRPELYVNLEQLTVGSFAIVLQEITTIPGLTDIIQATPFAGVGLAEADLSATVLGLTEVEFSVSGSPRLGGVDLGVLNTIASFLRVGVSAKIEKTTTTMTLSLATKGIELSNEFAFADPKDEGVKFDIQNVAGPMPSSRTSVYLPFRVTKPEANPVNGKYLYFILSTSYVTASTVAGISGTFEMVGTWEKAFGIPFVQLSDVTVSVGIDFTIIFELELAGKVCLGSQQACRDGDSTKSITGGGAVRYDRTDATKNYVMAYLDGSLTLTTMFGLFELEKIGIPTILSTDQVGFFPYKDGCEPSDFSCKLRFSYSAGVEDAMINGVTVPGGFYLQGAIKLPGFHMRGFVQFSRLQGRYEIDMEGRFEFKVAGTEIITVEGTTPGSDARFHVLASVMEGVLVDIEGSFNVPILLSHGDASIQVNGEEVSMTSKSLSLFGGAVSGSGTARWTWNSVQLKVHANVDLSPPLTTVSLGSGSIDVDVSPSGASFDIAVTVIGYTQHVSASITKEQLSFGFGVDAGLVSLDISVGVNIQHYKDAGSWMVKIDPQFNGKFAEEVGKFVGNGVTKVAEAVLNAVHQVSTMAEHIVFGSIERAKGTLMTYFEGVDNLIHSLDKFGSIAVDALGDLDHTMSEVMGEVGGALEDVADTFNSIGGSVGGFLGGLGGSIGGIFSEKQHVLSRKGRVLGASIRRGANVDDAGRALLDVAMMVSDASAAKHLEARTAALKKEQTEVVNTIKKTDFQPSISSFGNPYLSANNPTASLSLGVFFGKVSFGQTYVHAGNKIDISKDKIQGSLDGLKANIGQQGTDRINKQVPQKAADQAKVLDDNAHPTEVYNKWMSDPGYPYASSVGKENPCENRGLRSINSRCSLDHCTFDYTCAGKQLERCHETFSFQNAYDVQKGFRLVNFVPMHCPFNMIMSVTQKGDGIVRLLCCNPAAGYTVEKKQQSACAVKRLFDGEGRTPMYRTASCGPTKYLTGVFSSPCTDVKGDFYKTDFTCKEFSE
eukprot:TRINITY_DN39_c0_g1_i1.p1 TRINITY_DN39_c0_g1~~TRINITY_DN39_c0_g1_i1.p1  ORF type:complete len:1450 (+),score=562.27 TRINITY_DN39_c0_g1_i1:79-4428(+)